MSLIICSPGVLVACHMVHDGAMTHGTDDAGDAWTHGAWYTVWMRYRGGMVNVAVES